MRLPDPDLVYWDDWLLLLIQAATLVGLLIYVWKTWQIANESRRTAEASMMAVRESEQARLAALAPRVVVYFSADEIRWADIITENVGAGTAKDVVIRFEPELQSSHGERIRAFFDAPKPMMPPGYRLVHHLDSWPKYLEGDRPKRYTAYVTYTGAENGLAYSVEHILDVQAMEHRLSLERKGIPDLVSELGGFHADVRNEFRDLTRILERHHSFHTFRVSGENAGIAIERLLALWKVILQTSEREGASVKWSGAADFLHVQCLSAASSAAQESLPPAVQSALVDVLAAVVQPRFLGDEYVQTVAKAMEALAAAWPRARV
jgi:hypothetical protein